MSKFQAGDIIRCIKKTADWYDITIGNIYEVDTENIDGGGACYIFNRREYVQVVANDSSEPYTNWFADDFELVERDVSPLERSN